MTTTRRQLLIGGSVLAASACMSRRPTQTTPPAATSFGRLKQIEAGELDVGFAELEEAKQPLFVS